MWLGGTLEAKKVTCLKMLSGISRVSRNSSLTQGQEKKTKGYRKSSDAGNTETNER